MADQRHRPFGVGFLSVLLLIGGALQILAGILFLVDRNDDDLLKQTSSTSSEVTALGIAAIVMGVIVLLIASALRRGAGWARLLIGIIALLNFVGVVWVVLAYDSVHWYNVIGPAAIYGLVAGYLFFDDDAKAYFA